MDKPDRGIRFQRLPLDKQTGVTSRNRYDYGQEGATRGPFGSLIVCQIPKSFHVGLGILG